MSTTTGRARTRVNPREIKHTLDLLETSTFRATSEATGWNVTTIVRWKKRRDANPGWPTPEFIAAWEADDAIHGEARRIRAAKNADYRKRQYLARGNILQPATGTTRRLQALYAIGWTERDLADRLGVSICRISHLLTERRPLVHPKTINAVRNLYDELSMTVPADTRSRSRGQTRHHARARRRAKQLGWVPPLAWDDIDDPNETPYRTRHVDTYAHNDDVDEAVVERFLAGEKLRTTPAERREIMRRWLASGRSERSLCSRTGWKEGRYSPTRQDDAA